MHYRRIAHLFMIVTLVLSCYQGCSSAAPEDEPEPTEDDNNDFGNEDNDDNNENNPNNDDEPLNEEPLNEEPLNEEEPENEEESENSGDGSALEAAVYFGYDDYSITVATQDALTAKLESLNENTGLRITISGHCDERGSDLYNLSLGERRAHSVKTFLVNAGVTPDRIAIISYGEERPANPGHNEAAWQQNRRAEFERQ